MRGLRHILLLHAPGVVIGGPLAQSFVRRPDLVPLQTDSTHGPAAGQCTCEDEYYFLWPGYEDDDEPDHGAGIYDTDGGLVWMQPADGEGDDNFSTSVSSSTGASPC